MSERGKIKIIDIVLNEPQGDHQGMKQYFLVVDRNPVFIYSRHKEDPRLLIARDDCFYDALYFEKDKYAKAFAGRTFNIVMADGTTIEANGQFWNVAYPRDGLMHVGYGTKKDLSKCFVFTGGSILKERFEKEIEGREFLKYKDYEKEIKTRLLKGDKFEEWKE